MKIIPNTYILQSTRVHHICSGENGKRMIENLVNNRATRKSDHKNASKVKIKLNYWQFYLYEQNADLGCVRISNEKCDYLRLSREKYVSFLCLLAYFQNSHDKFLFSPVRM